MRLMSETKPARKQTTVGKNAHFLLVGSRNNCPSARMVLCGDHSHHDKQDCIAAMARALAGTKDAEKLSPCRHSAHFLTFMEQHASESMQATTHSNNPDA